MGDTKGVFDEFEEEFKNAEPAKAGSAIGRLPEGVYQGVCTQVDLAGDGKMVDSDIFGGGDKTKGIKIFLEILSPEKVGDVDVKGQIHEHVFWVTAKMLPYIKRDASTILGKKIDSLNQLANEVWAGHTVEFGLRDDTYNGFTRSKVSFFNAWNPNDPKAKTAEKPKKGAPPKKEGAQASTGAKSQSDF